MKKFFATLLMGAAVLTGSAQTEFRHISFDESLAAAKQEGKLVFIDFFTTWCGPCKMMSSKTFPQKEVGDFMNAKFIPLKMDAENEGLELAKKYGVTAYPTYVVIDANGKEVAKFSGYMDGTRFIDRVNAALDPEQQPERIKARYEKGERTPKLVHAYAMQLMEQRNEKEGFQVIDDYFNSLSDADRLKPENAFIFTVFTIDMNNDRARFMEAHQTEFPAEVRKDVDRKLQRLYSEVLSSYFSGFMFREGKYDAAEFNKLKATLAKLGLEREENKVIYEFIEKRPGSTDMEYLDYIIANYDRLHADRQTSLVFNLARLVAPDTPEAKAGISKFIRSKLSTLTPVAIQFAGRTLQSVEE